MALTPSDKEFFNLSLSKIEAKVDSNHKIIMVEMLSQSKDIATSVKLGERTNGRVTALEGRMTERENVCGQIQANKEGYISRKLQDKTNRNISIQQVAQIIILLIMAIGLGFNIYGMNKNADRINKVLLMEKQIEDTGGK